MNRHLEFMINFQDDDDSTKFKTLEVEKFRRVVDYFKSAEPDDNYIQKGRSDFYNFFTQHDTRRDTDFLKTFPEYKEFWNLCKEVSVGDDRKRKIVERRKKLRERICLIDWY